MDISDIKTQGVLSERCGMPFGKLCTFVAEYAATVTEDGRDLGQGSLADHVSSVLDRLGVPVLADTDDSCPAGSDDDDTPALPEVCTVYIFISELN